MSETPFFSPHFLSSNLELVGPAAQRMESIEKILVIGRADGAERINRTRLIDQVFVCYGEFLKCNSFNSIGIL